LKQNGAKGRTAAKGWRSGSFPVEPSCRPSVTTWPGAIGALAAAFGLVLAGCAGEGSGDVVRVHVPSGASFAQVTDSLAAKDIVAAPPLFELYARATGATGDVKPGTYAFRKGTGWKRVLADLRAGRVLTARVVIPEGWNLEGIAPRLQEATGLTTDSILLVLTDTSVVRRFDVPGPTLEGYLYPATYTFPIDASLDTVIGQMVGIYRRVWTTERAARAAELGFSEREIVALASIIEKEARIADEMPTISAVFHNRLEIGYPLQADPTVQYALGGHRQRLLYADIDSVADNPYNTYRNAGLPPGPIASPSERAIDAALTPADVDYLYFVARPDGSHVFTRSLEEHNRAKAAIRREVSRSGAAARPDSGTDPPGGNRSP